MQGKCTVAFFYCSILVDVLSLNWAPRPPQTLSYQRDLGYLGYLFVAGELIIFWHSFEVSIFPSFFFHFLTQQGLMNKPNFSDRYSILLLLPVALSNTNSISD